MAGEKCQPKDETLCVTALCHEGYVDRIRVSSKTALFQGLVVMPRFMELVLPRLPRAASMLSLSLLAAAVSGQESVQEEQVEAKSFRAVRVNTAPVMDGRLDDEVWQQAHQVTDFHQNRPGDHAVPSEITELYVVYTSEALYIAARMYDSDPELIAAPTIRHGQGLPFDDRLVIILDPFNQGRAGYRFETNLNGVRHDALYTTPTSFSLNWLEEWPGAVIAT